MKKFAIALIAIAVSATGAMAQQRDAGANGSRAPQHEDREQAREKAPRMTVEEARAKALAGSKARMDDAEGCLRKAGLVPPQFMWSPQNTIQIHNGVWRDRSLNHDAIVDCLPRKN